MKKISKILLMLSGVTLGSALQSCVSEEPFGGGEDGSLNIRARICSDVVTRSAELNANTNLRDKCVVYIESNKGVIRKFIGLDNIPVSPITLRQGHYVAEGWTGDSVSASFDKKFYRGKTDFEIASGENRSLLLSCNIANVITSVNPSVLDLDIRNVEITFSHSRGSLTFTQDNIASEKGYFMMPNADKDIQYTLYIEKNDGTTVERQGTIFGVERAHEYIMNIQTDDGGNQYGGGLIKVTIEDIPVIEETVEIYGRPTILGEGFDIEGQVVGDKTAEPGSYNAFTDKIVYVRAYEGVYRAELKGSNNLVNVYPELEDVNLRSPENYSRLDYENLGIVWDGPVERFDAASGKKMEEMRITFKKKFFDSLPESDTEYSIEIIIRDDQQAPSSSKSTTKKLRIANSDAAVEIKPTVETLDAPDPVSEPMGILAHSATLYGKVKDDSATDYGIRYRKQGDEDWITVPAGTTYSMRTRAAGDKYSVTLTGLEANTTYEYKAYESSYDNCEIQTFTTEAYFTIPNASFEEWSTYSAQTLLGKKNVILPWGVGDKNASFWGSGNEGGATANKVLTNKSTDMIHSGQYSARLESQSAAGMIAAGNIFVGEYVRTDGTNGVLSLGRSYNGSHPAKLKVWVNYRPGSDIIVKDGNPEGFESGNDYGQIYVALTSEPVEIRTNPSNLKVFDSNDPVVLGYGQVTFTGNYGPDGSLEPLEIPITYYDRGHTTAATHLVIVVSASKYGDYFTGASGSIMYLDDFELVYE